MAAPEVSSRFPAAPRSEMVSMATRMDIMWPRAGGAKRGAEEGGREPATPHDVDLVLSQVHVVAVSRDRAALGDPKAHQLPAQTFRLHVSEALLPDERGALVELDYPAQARLVRVGGVVNVVPV